MMMHKNCKREFAAEVKDRFRDGVYIWLLIMTCLVKYVMRAAATTAMIEWTTVERTSVN